MEITCTNKPEPQTYFYLCLYIQKCILIHLSITIKWIPMGHSKLVLILTFLVENQDGVSALPKGLGSCQKVLGGRALFFCSVITNDLWSQLASSAQAPKRISLGTLRFSYGPLPRYGRAVPAQTRVQRLEFVCLAAAGKERAVSGPRAPVMDDAFS